jgi:hypothetical protein
MGTRRKRIGTPNAAVNDHEFRRIVGTGSAAAG